MKMSLRIAVWFIGKLYRDCAMNVPKDIMLMIARKFTLATRCMIHVTVCGRLGMKASLALDSAFEHNTREVIDYLYPLVPPNEVPMRYCRIDDIWRQIGLSQMNVRSATRVGNTTPLWLLTEIEPDWTLYLSSIECIKLALNLRLKFVPQYTHDNMEWVHAQISEGVIEPPRMDTDDFALLTDDVAENFDPAIARAKFDWMQKTFRIDVTREDILWGMGIPYLIYTQGMNALLEIVRSDATKCEDGVMELLKYVPANEINITGLSDSAMEKLYPHVGRKSRAIMLSKTRSAYKLCDGPKFCMETFISLTTAINYEAVMMKLDALRRQDMKK